jgi:G3E family GTPase
VSYKALRRAVETLPDTIYRAKGIFFLAESPDRKGVLNVVGKRASLTFLGSSWETDTPRSQVVFIGTHGGIDPEALEARFDACLARNAPPSDLERITSAVIDWLRLRRPHAVQRETK